MSIPPFVCSTPPPPDQCEDDKDPDDFGLHYNLSQDEDEVTDYDFGNFSSYTHYQASLQSKEKEIETVTIVCKEDDDANSVMYSENIDSIVPSETSNINKSELSHKKKLGVEDLNLFKKVSSETTEDNSQINIHFQNKEEIYISNSSYQCSPSIMKECDGIGDNIEIKDNNNKSNKESILVSVNSNLPHIDELPFEKCTEEIKSQFGTTPTFPVNQVQTDISIKDDINDIHIAVKSFKSGTESEFEGFSNFDFTQNKEGVLNVTVDNNENPWKNAEIKDPDQNEFGDFKANFEDNILSTQVTENITKTYFEPDSENCQDLSKKDCIDVDDFGDFDDFKSSDDNTLFSTPPVSEDNQNIIDNLKLDLLNEIQLVEAFDKVVNSVFDIEIANDIGKFEGKFELLLGETWCHLVNTDIRQPYMVNWNNSLGQKILLKALCIDARNILFGTKWSPNTPPNFATNLTDAPLKPLSSQITSSNEDELTVVDKSANKTFETWTDPFSSTGNECTYAEALLLDLEHLMATLDQMTHNHSALKISDFLSQACSSEEASIATTSKQSDTYYESTTSKKIFSNTLNVQPLRISLPDTHIFTPIDSQIPRSKTIHYDSEPILMPKNILDDKKIDTSPVDVRSKEFVEFNNDDDFNDFEAFKFSDFSSSDKVTHTKHSETSSDPSDVSLQTQILQPVKVELMIPTVNWPDPGEVKVTYEDFSDLISESSWRHKDLSVEQNIENNKKSNLNDVGHVITNNTVGVELTTTNKNEVDDDFDKFQSALPAGNIMSSTDSCDSNPTFTSKNESLKNLNVILNHSESLQNSIINRSDNPSVFSTSSRTFDLDPLNSPAHPSTMPKVSSLLQPTLLSTSSMKSQEKGQILQPMSLESHSQINWPDPGIDLQDLSRFNPLETIKTLKSDLSVNSSKISSPTHQKKNDTSQAVEDDWGEFVSSKPKQPSVQKKQTPVVMEDEEWTDFVSSPYVKPQNGLNTISLNVHTNSNLQKFKTNKFTTANSNMLVDIPSLNYITPNSNNHRTLSKSHFQNL